MQRRARNCLFKFRPKVASVVLPVDGVCQVREPVLERGLRTFVAMTSEDGSRCRIATCNVNSLAGKLPKMLEHIEHHIDIVCLQEVCITETTSVAVRDRVEARGMRFLLNPASIRVNGVGVFGGIAVFSKWPIVHLKTLECVIDKAICIFFRVHRPRQVLVVACSIHIDAMRNSPSRRT